MRIAPEHVAAIVAHAREEMPNECCGIVATRDGEVVKVFPATNAEGSPVRYSLDPKEQFQITREVEDRGWELGAIYHSHTRSRAYPSQTDVNLAFYPDALYLIVSVEDPDSPDLRAFRIVDEVVDEVTLEKT